jgi:hypothetical protein
MTINFSGTAGQVREAFGTEIHALDVKGGRKSRTYAPHRSLPLLRR